MSRSKLERSETKEVKDCIFFYYFSATVLLKMKSAEKACFLYVHWFPYFCNKCNAISVNYSTFLLSLPFFSTNFSPSICLFSNSRKKWIGGDIFSRSLPFDTMHSLWNQVCTLYVFNTVKCLHFKYIFLTPSKCNIFFRFSREIQACPDRRSRGESHCYCSKTFKEEKKERPFVEFHLTFFDDLECSSWTWWATNEPVFAAIRKSPWRTHLWKCSIFLRRRIEKSTSGEKAKVFQRTIETLLPLLRRCSVASSLGLLLQCIFRIYSTKLQFVKQPFEVVFFFKKYPIFHSFELSVHKDARQIEKARIWVFHSRKNSIDILNYFPMNHHFIIRLLRSVCPDRYSRKWEGILPEPNLLTFLSFGL